MLFMLIKGYYNCAMPDEDFSTVRRNGGDVLLWAVDSQVRQFRNTSVSCPEKTPVLKKKKISFQKSS